MGKRKLNKNHSRRPKHKKKPWKRAKKATVTSLISKGHEPKCNCCDSTENLTFDHIFPKSRGGNDVTENGQILCQKCNLLKADRKITIEELKAEAEKLKE